MLAPAINHTNDPLLADQQLLLTSGASSESSLASPLIPMVGLGCARGKRKVMNEAPCAGLAEAKPAGFHITWKGLCTVCAIAFFQSSLHFLSIVIVSSGGSSKNPPQHDMQGEMVRFMLEYGHDMSA